MYPRFLQFGPIVIPTYGVLLAVGIICGLTLSVALARRAGLDSERVWNLGLIAILTSIAGARLLLALANWSSFRAAPLLLLSLSGLPSSVFTLGGIALALLACAAYVLRTGLPWLRTMDVAAPALALGHGFTCIGCFAAGCDYGRPTSLPWSVTFTSRFAARTTGAPLDIPLHPVQIYQAAASFALMALLLVLFGQRYSDSGMRSSESQKNGIQDGEIMGVWLFLSGLATFFLDFLRAEPASGRFLHGTITVAQSLAILMVLAGGVLWLRPHRVQKEAVLAG